MPPAASRIPGKYLANYLCFEGDGEAAGGPGKLSLVLDEIERLLVEREVKELSLPVYDPNRGKMHPRELYALIRVIFSDTNVQVYLRKKNYLCIG